VWLLHAGGTAQNTRGKNSSSKKYRENSNALTKLPGHKDEDMIQCGQGPIAGPLAEPVKHSKVDMQ
jgi:hypothetical protein